MMDDYDRAILEIVQRDNRRTHAQIGDAVNLSESSVRRRLKRLRGTGIIRADVAILDAAETMVTVIVTVRFRRESVRGIQEFRRRMIEAQEVSQCYSVTGETDYILVVHAPSLNAYDEWGKDVLLADPSIQRYDSFVVWSTVKFSTVLPIGALEQHASTSPRARRRFP